MEELSNMTDDETIRESCVLVVDNEKELLEHIAEYAQTAEIDIVCVSNSRDAKYEIEQKTFTSIIVDMRMASGDEDGTAILRIARENNPGARLYLLTAFQAFLTREQKRILWDLHAITIAKTALTLELLISMLRGEVTREEAKDQSDVSEDTGIVALERSKYKRAFEQVKGINDAFIGDLIEGLNNIENRTGRTLYMNGRWTSIQELLRLVEERSDEAIQIILAYRDIRKLQKRW